MGKDLITITGTSLAFIADNMAQFLYKKSLKDCLGQKQNLPCTTFRRPEYLKINLIIPEGLWVRPNRSKEWSGTHHETAYYIASMVAHAQKEGYAVTTTGTRPVLN